MATTTLKTALRVLAGVVLSLALVLAAITTAQADSMNLAYRGNKSVTVWVDGQKKSSVTAEFYTPGTYQDSLWFGYCVDPLQTFKNPIDPGDPNSWTGPEIYPQPTDVNWHEAAWLMQEYAPGYSWLQDQGSVDYTSAAVKLAIQAVQLAIWETVVDPNATYTASSVTDTSSRFYTTSGAAATLAGEYLVALSEYKSAHGGVVNLDGSLDYKINDQSDRQDLIVATPGASTPEPGTMLLFASALAMGGGYLRRKIKRA